MTFDIERRGFTHAEVYALSRERVIKSVDEEGHEVGVWSMLAIIIFGFLFSAAVHFFIEPEIAAAKEMRTDNTPFCVLVEQGIEVVEEYAGQTEQMCLGAKEKKTAFQTFNSIVWAVTL